MFCLFRERDSLIIHGNRRDQLPWASAEKNPGASKINVLNLFKYDMCLNLINMEAHQLGTGHPVVASTPSCPPFWQTSNTLIICITTGSTYDQEFQFLRNQFDIIHLWDARYRIIFYRNTKSERLCSLCMLIFV